MRLRRRQPQEHPTRVMYRTRAREISLQTLDRAKRARREALVLVPLIAAVLFAYHSREALFGVDVPVRIAAVVALVLLGGALARDVGRVVAPSLFRRLDPGTAATVGFLLRLFLLGIATLFSLRLAGLQPQTLAIGGAVTAVVFGLAAQQTLGNVIAGTVLLSARPFRVGDRVRLQGGGLAGVLEGTVETLGLLYTTLAQGEDLMLVPNNVVLSSAVVPLREPAAVDLRARLRPGVKPSEVQALLDDQVTVPTRADPHIGLEEVDGGEVVVRIGATPRSDQDGAKLADEVLAAVSEVTR